MSQVEPVVAAFVRFSFGSYSNLVLPFSLDLYKEVNGKRNKKVLGLAWVSPLTFDGIPTFVNNIVLCNLLLNSNTMIWTGSRNRTGKRDVQTDIQLHTERGQKF